MAKLNEIQKKIIGCLLFTEPFEHILEETKGKANIIADELKQLIDARMVQVMEDNGNGGYKKTFFYDTDNMHAFSYLATEKGITAYGSPA